MTELGEIKSAVVTAAAAANVAAAKSSALEVRLFSDVLPAIQKENEFCAIQRRELEKGLTVVQEDIKTIKEKHKHDDIKDYIHYSTGPLIVALHAVLRHFGIDV